MSVESYDDGDYTVTIEVDDGTESPREWGRAGTFVHWHRRMSLGDEFVEPVGATPADMAEWLRTERGAVVVVPVWCYQHGAVRLVAADDNPFSCPWDSGQVGFIYCTGDELAEDFLGDLDVARAALVGDIAVLDQWLNGDVYRFLVERDGELVDAVGGFYGLDDARAEADAAVAGDREARFRLHGEQLTLY